MSASNRGFFKRGPAFKDQKSIHIAEDAGNRRTFEETRVPPDNVGNNIEYESISSIIHDGLGNCVDEEPSHLKSGVLSHLAGQRGRNSYRKTTGYQTRISDSRAIAHGDPSDEQLAPKPKAWKMAEDRNSSPGRVKSNELEASAFMELLAQDFAKLLQSRSGLPFSFSVKPIKDHEDEQAETEKLDFIKMVLIDILHKTNIEATVSLIRYGMTQHRFAVYYISPKERDPAKNKELISALRQVLAVHSHELEIEAINLFLVLANAQQVIEGHLKKIGAKRVSEPEDVKA